MRNDLEYIAKLERLSYLAMKLIADVSPGSEVILRDDVLLLSNQSFPMADFNQACLLRSTPETVDALIAEVTEYFQSKELPATFFLSEACVPGDITQRLLKQGFVDVGYKESWLIIEDLQSYKIPKIDNSIVAKKIDKSETSQFAQVMAAAYEMPDEWIEALTYVLEPSVGIPGVTHYLGLKKDQAISTLTLMCYQEYGVFGSAGVLPEYRGTRAIFNLAAQVGAEAKQNGIKTIILQTSLGPLFERFLSFCGFKLAFKRRGYTQA